MKYIKKPIEIEAFQYDGDLKNSNDEWYVPDWAVKAFEDGTLFYGDMPPWELFIKTLEGPLHISVDDFIIQGVKGELYPCKPDIFMETYEPVNPPKTKRVFSKEKFLEDSKNLILQPDPIWLKICDGKEIYITSKRDRRIQTENERNELFDYGSLEEWEIEVEVNE